MSGQMTFREKLNSAVAHHRAGRLTEAERIYRQVLSQRPDQAEVLHLLGILSAQVGKSGEGIELIRRAISNGAPNAVYYNDLANVLKADGQIDQAIAAYRQAIRLNPDLAEVHANLGIALEAQGQLDDAIASFRQAIRLKPDYAEAHICLGSALNDKGQYVEAITSHRQAIRLKPDLAEAHKNLGDSCKSIWGLDEAIACYRKAISIKPDYADAYLNLGNAIKDTGRLDEAIATYRKVIQLTPDFAAAHSNLVYTFPFHPDYDAGMIYEENRRWNQQHAKPLKSLIPRHANPNDPDRRLRIGYISPDFGVHCQSFFTIPLFSNHDRKTFEIFCYSDVLWPDAVTERIRGLVDAWRPVSRTTDAEVARQIREDQIDILVDLTLHMAKNRMLLFARKPAPVQVTWLGYPGTTGLSTMDYRLTDPYLDPPGSDDHFYSETSVRLPDTFWCYDPLDTALAVNGLPAQSRGFITFGSLNNFCKVTEQVPRLWAQVLKAVDRSRLMILCPEGSHRQPLLDLLQREGIHPDRIELVAPRPRAEYLELYHRIDLGLDTLPYNGHTTSLDSIWMGVPVITLVGRTAVGRAGMSQSTNLGLTELIAQTPQEYVEIAAGVARDLPRLAELRRTLRSRMQASPLMDAPRFARNIEAAYRRMWRNWCGEQTGP
jgi:protein O-GlcNAc transferase